MRVVLGEGFHSPTAEARERFRLGQRFGTSFQIEFSTSEVT
jgi:hypothetical protein